VGYGYRFTRLFQADVGFQVAFGAADNQNAEVTDLGPVQGGDREYMIPLGARFIMHYSETVPSNGYCSSACYSCTSRGGWGGYGVANASHYLGANHNFHVGTTFEFIAASTNGQAVGNVAAARTTDHWSNLFPEFAPSF
jgi:hypothetical protein